MDATTLTALLGSLGLGAASGLNPWIPLLGIGLAARTDEVVLSSGFDWLGSNAALGVLCALFVLDLVGDKVALVDSVLHAGGVIVAPASGAIVLAAQSELSAQLPTWVLAALGVVLAGSLQAGRGALRPAVSLATGGAGNPVVSLLEDATSLCLVVLAFVVPVLSALAAVAVAVVVLTWLVRRRRRAAERTTHPGG